MNGDLKLKVIAEEIKEILKKHDVAGAVALHTPGHGEYFVTLNPSYSCVYQVKDEEIRLYAKKADFATIEEYTEKVTNSSNMLVLLTDCLGTLFMNTANISKMLDEKINAVHSKREGSV